MKVTKVELTPYTGGKGSMVGYGSVEFDEIMSIRINIMKSAKDGSLFVSWPSVPNPKKEGEWFRQVYLAKSPEAFALNDEIISNFNKILALNTGRSSGTTAPKTPTPPSQSTTDNSSQSKPMFQWV